jgi:hypothetical protein
MHIRPFGRRDKLCHRLVEQRLEPGVIVGAVISGEDTLMLALIRNRRLLLRLPGSLG